VTLPKKRKFKDSDLLPLVEELEAGLLNQTEQSKKQKFDDDGKQKNCNFKKLLWILEKTTI
jgi:uncharacterized membrane protein required for colicin V production|tara:strand:+ start:1476 stop:1658 length:183 start_codon:yes stop_codon:yes gene_type:complete